MIFRLALFSLVLCDLSGIEGCERLTTLGIAVNLVTYLTGTMHLGNASSANVVTNFMGTSFMLCLFGGFLADTFIGRFVIFTYQISLFIKSKIQLCSVFINYYTFQYLL